jgi:hypothetical protein
MALNQPLEKFNTLNDSFLVTDTRTGINKNARL